MKKMIRVRTIAEYIAPMPYAQRQVVWATKKPNANGDKNGDMIKPIVQTLSFRGRKKINHYKFWYRK
jgi:hypothetical protein